MALAGEPSPRRQAELDAVVARRHSVRQARATSAARRNAELASELQSLRSYEVALAQSNALYQLATAQREAQVTQRWLSRGTDSRQCSPTRGSVLSPVTYPPYSLGWTSAVPYGPIMGLSSVQTSLPSHATASTVSEAPTHQASLPTHLGAHHH